MVARKLIVPASLVAVLVLLGVAMRLASRDGLVPPNFSPIAACAIFCGFYFRRNLLAAFGAPLLAMFVSDMFIVGYAWQVRLAVYGALLAPAMLGRAIGASPTLSRRALMIPLSSLAASMFFFVTTNVAEFAFGIIYPRTLDGLGECFLSALPFFRYTVLGDLVFTTTLFGLYGLAQVMAPQRHALAPVPAA